MHNQPNINEAFLFNTVEIYLQSLACNQPKITPQPRFKINKKTLEKRIKNEVGYYHKKVILLNCVAILAKKNAK